MAFLQNLIVTGGSKFLNKIYATDIEVDGTFETSGNLSIGGTLDVAGNTILKAVTSTSIDNSGTFINRGGVELINSTPYIDFRFGKSTSDYTSRIIEEASGTITIKPNLKVGTLATIPTATITTANITTGNLDSGTADNFNVTNKLHATHFDLQSVAQLGGAFYVSPTIKFPTDSNTTFTITKSGATANIIISDSAITSTTLAGVVWGTNAKVKASGKIGTVTTGTMDGTVTGINTSNHTLTISVSGENSSSITAGTYTSADIDNFCVMMYNTGTYPVGIMMNSYGTDGRTYIDIHGGTSSATEPNVRIGNLGGLSFNGTTLSNQWGIYTNNGYYTGSIVANGGKIGGFTIGETAIYTGTVTSNADNSVALSSTDFTRTIGSTSRIGLRFAIGDKIGITGDGVLYAHSLQASGGKIGGWNIASDFLYNYSTVTTGTASTQYGFRLCVGTSQTNQIIRAGSRSYDGTNYGSWENKFYVRNDGYMYAVSGNIGGWTIGTNTLSRGTIGTLDGVFLIPAGSTNNYSIGGSESINDWTITSGANFGVTASGAVYCSDIHATGEITATSGYIGTTTNGFTIDSSGFYSGTKTANTSGYIALSNSNFTRTINSTSISTLRFAIGSKFGVATDGTLYANGANIKNISASNISSGSLSADRISAGSLAIGKLTLDAQETISDAAKTATNYFYYNTTDGLIMSSSASTQTYAGASTGYNTRLTNSALQIRNGTNVLASYGSTITIGQSGNSQQVIDSTTLKFKDGKGDTQFTINNNTTGYIKDYKAQDLILEAPNSGTGINKTTLATALYNYFRGYTCTSNSNDYCTTTNNCRIIVKLCGGYLYNEETGPDYSEMVGIYEFNLTGLTFTLNNNVITATKTTSGDSASSYTTIVNNYMDKMLERLNDMYQADDATYEATEADTDSLNTWVDVYFEYPVISTSMTLGTRSGNLETGCGSLSVGKDNNITGNYSVALGEGLEVNSDYSTVIGSYNLPLYNSNTGLPEEVAFAVGAGDGSERNRRTPFAVLKNGTVVMSNNNANAGLRVTVAPNTKETIVTPFAYEMPFPPFIFLTLESRGKLNNIDNIKDMGKVQIYLHEVTTKNFTVYIINNGNRSHEIGWRWFAICTN